MHNYNLFFRADIWIFLTPLKFPSDDVQVQVNYRRNGWIPTPMQRHHTNDVTAFEKSKYKQTCCLNISSQAYVKSTSEHEYILHR
jgi:hypothetical protein